MKVLITGVTGFRNRGVEALIVPIIEQIRARAPEASFKILTRTPEYDAQRTGEGVQFLLERAGVGRLGRLKDRAARLRPALSPSHSKLLEAVREADVVIASGGDIFSSDYGSMEPHLAPLQEAIRVSAPVVFLAHSIGPFRTSEEIARWREVAAKAALVTLRETRSYEYVTQTVGLSPDIAIQTADTAFLLNPAPAETADALIGGMRLRGERPRVGLAMSSGIRKFAGLAQEAHAEAWKAVVRFVVDDLEADAVFVPHVQDASFNDDRVVQSQLLRELDFDPRVQLLGPDLSAAEFKAVLGRCGLVVAERMHAAIGALSMGTPTLPVKYSVKAQGIMEDLLGPELASTFLVEIDRFLEPGRSVEAVREAWANREVARTRLQESIPAAKRESERNFDLLFDRLGGPRPRQVAVAHGDAR